MDANNNNVAPEVPTTTESKSQRISKGPKKGSKSHLKNSQGRMEAHRRATGKITNEKYDMKLRDELYAGTTPEEIEARLKEHANMKAMMLSVTSRGVGVNLSYALFTSLAYNQSSTPPNLYSLYRVCLAMFEHRVIQVQENYPVPPRFSDKAAVLVRSAEFDKLCRAVIFLPEPVRKVLDSIGIVKVGALNYIPTIAGPLVDKNEVFVPMAENVHYSNLRKVVVALADTHTPVEYRRRFYLNSALPGAVWDAENFLLQNADDIMPGNYSIDSLGRDSLMITPWLSNLQKFVPKMISGPVSIKPEGRIGALLSNGMETLRLPDMKASEPMAAYLSRCIPEGNIRSANSLVELAAADRLEGQLVLLGERPSYKNVADPLYLLRNEAVCPYEYTSGHQAAAKMFMGI